MSLVFISHAHRDETLARKVAALLGDALGLSPSDFFLSSQAGQGVAPAASIRASVVDESLRNVSAMVVLITPEAAARPWVWLEAGNRLGCTDKPSPIFIVPSARFVPLLAPVADLRCLKLDNDGELHEFVRAVGKCVGRPPQDFLSYTPVLEEVAHAASHAYSPWAERWAWLRRYAMVSLLMVSLVGGLFWLGMRGQEALQQQLTTAQEELAAAYDELTETTLSLNAGAVADAGRVYLLKGQVSSRQDGEPVHEAAVMVSRTEARDPAACEQSDECTVTTTLTDGTFTLDLTQIQAAQGEEVVLSVNTPGFRFFSTRLTVDVRATNAGAAPQLIELAAP